MILRPNYDQRLPFFRTGRCGCLPAASIARTRASRPRSEHRAPGVTERPAGASDYARAIIRVLRAREERARAAMSAGRPALPRTITVDLLRRSRLPHAHPGGSALPFPANDRPAYDIQCPSDVPSSVRAPVCSHRLCAGKVTQIGSAMNSRDARAGERASSLIWRSHQIKYVLLSVPVRGYLSFRPVW
jgi:hypothetical protein